MARFYATARNGRGNMVGIGGRGNAGEVHLRGWNAGVEVEPRITPDGRDAFDIYMTPGSTGAGHRVLIGTVEDAPRASKHGPWWRPAKGRKSVKA